MLRIVPCAQLYLVLMVFDVLPFAGVAFGQWGDDISANENGGSAGTSDGEWYWTSNFENIRGYAERPDEKLLQAITVEWKPLEPDPLGNLCIVRGRLIIPGDGQQASRPVNWFQGATIFMSKAPDDTPDWSAGMNELDTVSGERTLVNPSGEFVVRIDVRETEYDRDRPQSFQFGLALARHTVTGQSSQQVHWTSRSPAIPSSVQKLEVPAVPKLSHELDLINRASHWPSSNPNSVLLIRAVNALQPLGKEQALATLEEYLRLTGPMDEYDYDEDREIVFWIIRVLFEPIRLDERIPQPGIFRHFIDGNPPESANWPLNPIAIIDDIPFMLGQQIGGWSGPVEEPSSHIEWARWHGVLRDEPLSPRRNPLEAAVSILNRQPFKPLGDYAELSGALLVKSQAMAMVEDLLPPMSLEYTLIPEDQIQQRLDWKIRVRQAVQSEIHWDAEREAFVGK